MERQKLINYCLIIYGLLIKGVAFAQPSEIPDSMVFPASKKQKMKPEFHYSIGSSFTYIPGYGSVSGFTISPGYQFPVTDKLSLQTGLIAGHYIPFQKYEAQETVFNYSGNSIALYGAASYQLNQKLSIYGIGSRQIAGNLPLYRFPTSSFSIGSTLDLGNFSIGAEIRVNNSNYNHSLFPMYGKRDYFSPYSW